MGDGREKQAGGRERGIDMSVNVITHGKPKVTSMSTSTASSREFLNHRDRRTKTQTDRPTAEKTNIHTPHAPWGFWLSSSRNPLARKDRTRCWTLHRRSHPYSLCPTFARHTSLGLASKEGRSPSCGAMSAMCLVFCPDTFQQ